MTTQAILIAITILVALVIFVAVANLAAVAAFVSLWLKSLSFQKYELGLRSLPAYGGINGTKKDFFINLSIILQKMEIGSQRVLN
jgi:hypothetical protein